VNENNNQNEAIIPQIAIASLFLGVSSLILLVVSFGLGIYVKWLTISDVFGLVFVAGLAAIICGILAKNKIKKERLPGNSITNIGLILGSIAVFLTVLSRFAIFLLFVPWLGA